MAAVHLCLLKELKSGGVLDMTSDMEKKRQDHINELITTEDTYMKDLTLVLDVSKIRLVEDGFIIEKHIYWSYCWKHFNRAEMDRLVCV